ncbi:type II secretion system F family protein [Candidatus Poriferisocius sp.]|uniref:type II secretion system F family protein n=1 Tax=Candidatus Poriferisocius sp. TaxID=3101276 RepID=UPI003B0168D6
MNLLIASLLGASLGSGIFITALGWRGIQLEFSYPNFNLLNKLQIDTASLLLCSTLAGTGFFITLVLTRWVVAGLIIGIVGFYSPAIWGARANRQQETERMIALATWTEMVRDTISAAPGLIETLKATALTAPSAIRPQVRQLAARAERESLPLALAKFADETDHAIADNVAITLGIAAGNQGGTLQELLTELANNTRQEVSMRLRIEASRTRQFTSARFIAGVIVIFSVGMVGFNKSYLAPFNSISGQIALAIIGGLFIGSGGSLIKMSKFNTQPRILNVHQTFVNSKTTSDLKL